jgi:sugar O-acyltransferase (sialic acid O-acetyltransferase NeuD family)
MAKIPLIIFGTENFAEIAFEYFTHDSDYEVVAFTVDKAYLKENEKFNLPVIPFEEIHKSLDPRNHFFFAAVTYGEINDLRSRILARAKNLGFAPASYISSKGFIWHNVTFGEHCFIFEDNTIQPFVKVGNNVVVWSGNHIGHHSQIMDNVFISSHVVISGNCSISNNCFLGVNSTLANNLSIGPRTWIGPGVLLTRDIPAGSLVTNSASKIKILDEDLLNSRLKQISNSD